MSAELPPEAALARVVTGVVAHLRGDWDALLADERWADVAASVERLAAPGALPPLARQLGPRTCGRLTDLLLARWAAIGEVRLPAAAAIVPDDDGVLALVVAGLAPGWRASWTGPVEPLEADGSRVRVVAPTGQVAARVFGRESGARTILAVGWERPQERDARG